MHYIGEPVADYGTYPSRVDELLAYPGERPAGSFLVTEGSVYEVAAGYGEFHREVDEHLRIADQPLLAGRVPILAYGANANPARIISKLQTYGLRGSELIVPYVGVAVPSTAAVWHGRPGQGGSTFAELYRGEAVENGTLTTHLAYMTTAQVATMHASEGANYGLVRLTAEVGTDREPRSVLAYAGFDASVLVKDGAPVGVAGLSNATPLESMTAEQAVDYMLQQEGVAGIADAATARQLVEAGMGMKLAQKKERQAAIGDRLRALGVCRPYVFPAAEGQFVPRLSIEGLTGERGRIEDGSHLLQGVIECAASVGKDLARVLHKRAEAERLIAASRATE